MPAITATKSAGSQRGETSINKTSRPISAMLNIWAWH
jgi:hypothetical protein